MSTVNERYRNLSPGSKAVQDYFARLVPEHERVRLEILEDRSTPNVIIRLHVGSTFQSHTVYGAQRNSQLSGKQEENVLDWILDALW